MKQFDIGKNEAGQRLDKYLHKLLPQAGSSFLYKMLRKKNIVLNGKKAAGSEHLTDGDSVKLYLSDETFEKFCGAQTKPQAGAQMPQMPQLDILYEDADILIINKPAGLLSQKAKREDVSANELIIDYLLAGGQITPQQLLTFHPSVCNRLDRNTSGILIAGKTLAGLQNMSAQLKERSVAKYYRCIVRGEITKPQHLKGYLVKDNAKNKVTVCADAQGQPIETEYRPVKNYDGYTMLEVHLITGRTHQIRAHLAAAGHPLLGDAKYGDAATNEKLFFHTHINRQLLHAYRLVLADGREITAPLPDDFAKAERYFV